MKRRLFAIHSGLLLALLLYLIVPAHGHAAGAPAIALRFPHSTTPGLRIPVVAHVTDAGAPVVGARILFFVNGERDGEARTDANGNASWRIRRVLTAGLYRVEAAYTGPPQIRTVATLAVAAPQLSLQLPSGGVQVGQAASFQARVSDSAGDAIPSALVTFLADGAVLGKARTGADGMARWRTNDLPAGYHAIQAVFERSGALIEARASASLRIEPVLLEVHTTPALAGARFLFAGRSFNAGSDGVARIPVERSGIYSLTLLDPPTINAWSRAEFAGWGDRVQGAERSVSIPARGPLYANFNLSYLVNPLFLGPDGEKIEPRRISSFSITSSIGRRLEFKRVEPIWLVGAYAVRSGASFETRQIGYAVETATMEGANVVGAASTRFFPSTSQVWEIDAGLYSATFNARDALFGFPTGTAIYLNYPDGHTERIPFGPDAAVTVEGLPRGMYRVSVDAPGLATVRPLVLSRHQTVSLGVLSYLDLAVTSLALFVLALALLFIGRPRLLRLFTRGGWRRPSSLQPETVALEPSQSAKEQ